MLRRTLRLIGMVIGLTALTISTSFAGPTAESGESSTAPASSGAEMPTMDVGPTLGDSQEWTTLSQYQSETGNTITAFNESPMLRAMVASGELPAIEQRLPVEPLVQKPYDSIGTYSDRPLRLIKSDTEGGPLGAVAHHGAIEWNRGTTELRPWVIQDFEYASDGKALTLTLREGLRLSNGTEHTADDWVFWWEDIARNDEIEKFMGNFTVAGQPMTVHKIDDYTVQFRFAAPFWNVHLSLYGTRRAGLLDTETIKKYHIRYNADANDLAKEHGFDSWALLVSGLVKDPWRPSQQFPHDLNLEIATTGPWRYKDSPTGAVVWERNPYYHHIDPEGNQLPYIDSVITTVLQDPETVRLKIIAGDVDWDNGELTLEHYPLLLEEQTKGKYQVRLAPGANAAEATIWTNLTYRADPVLSEILGDVRFRRAISMAIDRDDINDTIYFGEAVPRQNTVAPPASYYKDEWATAYATRDIDEANRLLDEMGLRWDSDRQWRLRPDGDVLAVEVVTPSEMQSAPIVELVVEHWKEIGVRVDLKMTTKNAFYETIYANDSQIAIRPDNHGLPVMQILYRALWRRPQWWAPLWHDWLVSDGEKGEEPPQWVKEYNDIINSASTMDQATLDREMAKVFDRNASDLLSIGTVGMVASPVLISNDLVNVADRFWSNSGVLAYGFGNQQRPGEWYWKN